MHEYCSSHVLCQLPTEHRHNRRVLDHRRYTLLSTNNGSTSEVVQTSVSVCMSTPSPSPSRCPLSSSLYWRHGRTEIHRRRPSRQSRPSPARTTGQSDRLIAWPAPPAYTTGTRSQSWRAKWRRVGQRVVGRLVSYAHTEEDALQRLSVIRCRRKRVKFVEEAGPRSGPRDPGLEKPWIRGTDLGPVKIPQIHCNRLKFQVLLSHCPLDSNFKFCCLIVLTVLRVFFHTEDFPPSFRKNFDGGKKNFIGKHNQESGLPQVR